MIDEIGDLYYDSGRPELGVYAVRSGQGWRPEPAWEPGSWSGAQGTRGMATDRLEGSQQQPSSGLHAPRVESSAPPLRPYAAMVAARGLLVRWAPSHGNTATDLSWSVAASQCAVGGCCSGRQLQASAVLAWRAALGGAGPQRLARTRSLRPPCAVPCRWTRVATCSTSTKMSTGLAASRRWATSRSCAASRSMRLQASSWTGGDGLGGWALGQLASELADVQQGWAD
jgi:hypothetical protein